MSKNLEEKVIKITKENVRYPRKQGWNYYLM